MTVIKVFCMTKNEYDLIEDFILYYGYLFGYKNVTIIDNNSDNPQVLDIYIKYQKLGLNVVFESNYTNQGQGDAFTKYMTLEKFNCDFLIGLDTDEFLFSLEDLKNGNDSFCKTKILQIFDNYKLEDTLFKINIYPTSVVDILNDKYVNNKFINPATDIIYFTNQVEDVKKFFVRSNSFINTNNGNHSINTSYGNKIYSSLGLLHFHNTGRKRVYERSKAVIDGYQYFSTSLDIKEQINILSMFKNRDSVNGYHKIAIYYDIILQMFLFELFVTYIKRLPTINELRFHSYEHIGILPDIIEYEFKTCPECIENKDKIFTLDNDIEKNNLIFYDEPMNIIELESNKIILKNTDLQKLLLQIKCANM